HGHAYVALAPQADKVAFLDALPRGFHDREPRAQIGFFLDQGLTVGIRAGALQDLVEAEVDVGAGGLDSGAPQVTLGRRALEAFAQTVHVVDDADVGLDPELGGQPEPREDLAAMQASFDEGELVANPRNRNEAHALPFGTEP